DFFFGVTLPAGAAQTEDIGDAFFFPGGGFDLHAQELAVQFDGKIVAGRSTPGSRDIESVLAGADHESSFGPFPAQTVTFHEFGFDSHGLPQIKSWIKRKRRSR